MHGRGARGAARRPRSQAGRRAGYDRTCRDRTGAARRAHEPTRPLPDAARRRDRHRRPREGSASSSRTPSSTTSSSCAPTARRSTTSASSSTTSTCGSRTSSAATTTSPTRRGRSCSTRRSTRRCPRFAHLPLILGADKARLSQAPRRHVGARVPRPGLPARRAGQLSSPASAGRTAIRSSSRRDELIEHFSLEHVGKSPAVFNPEKLAVAELPVPEGDARRGARRAASAPSFSRPGLPVPGDGHGCARRRDAARAREDARRAGRGCCASTSATTSSSTPKAAAQHLTPAIAPALADLDAAARALAAWDASTHRGRVSATTVAAHGLALGKLAQPVRVGGHRRHREPGHLRGARRPRARAHARAPARGARATRERLRALLALTPQTPFH